MTTIAITTLLISALAFFLVTCLRAQTVYEWQKGLRLRKGVVQAELAPGRHWAFAPGTSFIVFEAREETLDVPGQEILTRDQVPVKLSLVVTYQLEDPRVAVTSSGTYVHSLYLAAQLALRAEACAVDLDVLLADRSALDAGVLERLVPEAARLGLSVARVALKDVMVAGDLKRAFGDVAKARAEARAKLERARGETASLRNLVNAARLVAEHTGLYELRLLETARDAAACEGTSLVIGVPDQLKPKNG